LKAANTAMKKYYYYFLNISHQYLLQRNGMAAIPINSKIKFVKKVHNMEMVPNLLVRSIIEFYASNNTPVHPIL
jgi:hypothetical protein